MSKLPKISILFLFIVGCSSQIRPAFVSVLYDHKVLTTETSVALIKSIEEEKKTTTKLEEIKTLNDLIIRLQTISKQSEVLYDYIKNNMTEEQLAAYIKFTVKGNK